MQSTLGLQGLGQCMSAAIRESITPVQSNQSKPYFERSRYASPPSRMFPRSSAPLPQASKLQEPTIHILGWHSRAETLRAGSNMLHEFRATRVSFYRAPTLLLPPPSVSHIESALMWRGWGSGCWAAESAVGCTAVAGRDPPLLLAV